MSYTQANDHNNWMDRLPRIQSRSRSQMKAGDQSDDLEEKLADYTPSNLPRAFLRRQKDDDTPSRTPSLRSIGRRRRWDTGIGPGGPVEQSAIGPRRTQPSLTPSPEKSMSDSTAVPSPSPEDRDEPQEEIYREGSNTVIEDESGNVLEVLKADPNASEKENEQKASREGRRLMYSEDIKHGESQKQAQDPMDGAKQDAAATAAELSQTETKSTKRDFLSKITSIGSRRTPAAAPPRAHGPARAFKFGNTIIVEDEDGEVIKKYNVPPPLERKQSYGESERTKQRLQKMGKWIGIPQEEEGQEEQGSSQRRGSMMEDDDDDRIRFTMAGNTRRLSKADFIKQLQMLDPKSRMAVAEESDAPETVKRDVKEDAEFERKQSQAADNVMTAISEGGDEESVHSHRSGTPEPIPVHSFSDDLRKFNAFKETAAERRRRAANTRDDDSDDDGTVRIPRGRRGSAAQRSPSASPRATGKARATDDGEEETAAERRRREAALGLTGNDDSDEEVPKTSPKRVETDDSSSSKPRNIRFVDPQSKTSTGSSSLRWGANKGR